MDDVRLKNLVSLVGTKTGFVLAFLLFNFVCTCTLNSQVDEIDSLRTDSAQNQIRIQLNDADFLAGFEPLDSIKPSDSLDFQLVKKKKSPQRAALYSAILPGLGQAYNGKYWKIPIIYSIFAGMYFLAEDNHQKYLDFKNAYINFDDPEKKPLWVNENSTKNDIKDRKDYYKRNRDFNIIIGSLVYLLNILDANVDAHLMDFDISDDLSLHLQPEINYFQASQKNQKISGFGIKFVLSWNR